ncbi:hypothetical protein [Sorangium sp. So ce1153]
METLEELFTPQFLETLRHDEVDHGTSVNLSLPKVIEQFAAITD